MIFNEDILLPLRKLECIDNDTIMVKKGIKDLSLQEKSNLEWEEVVNKDHTNIPKE